MGEKHGVGRGQGGATFHRGEAQAVLHDGLGLSQFRARVDAAQLGFVSLDSYDTGAVSHGQAHQVCQIVLAA